MTSVNVEDVENSLTTSNNNNGHIQQNGLLSFGNFDFDFFFKKKNEILIFLNNTNRCCKENCCEVAAKWSITFTNIQISKCFKISVNT